MSNSPLDFTSAQNDNLADAADYEELMEAIADDNESREGESYRAGDMVVLDDTSVVIIDEVGGGFVTGTDNEGNSISVPPCRVYAKVYQPY